MPQAAWRRVVELTEVSRGHSTELYGLIVQEGPNLNELAVNESYPMQERKQKTQIGASTQKDRTEYEGYVSGPTFGGITENNLTGDHQSGYGMLEEILSPSNLNAAYQEVVRNNGAGRIDGMEVESLKDYLVTHREALLTSLYRGKYRPNPVRRVEIPKEERRW